MTPRRPTAKQVRLIADLERELGRPVREPPATRAGAAGRIDALIRRKRAAQQRDVAPELRRLDRELDEAVRDG